MTDRVNKKLDELKATQLSPEERAIMRCLYASYKRRVGERLTQNQLAKSEAWLGCHEDFELDKVRNPDSTTLRKVRQIIRDLRVNYNAPILSDRDGYWIPTHESEVHEYLERVEREAKSQARSWVETYKSVEKAFGVSSEFFSNLNLWKQND